MIPFYLTYGRTSTLPIDDIEVEETDNTQNLLTRTHDIVKNLENKRREALNNIESSQRKQKERFDSKLKEGKRFEIGDKVLLKDSAKEKQWSGKLEPKWKGPYYIHEIITKGAYRLRTVDGKVLRASTNVINLKLYQDRVEWEPKIYI